MTPTREIRADHDGETIVVYQAYREAIGRAALEAGKFVPPFSLERMTWIKPSFLWMMERSNWGRKPGQEYGLAVRIRRAGWDEALSRGVLTSYTQGSHRNFQDWQRQFSEAPVHVQWDPERSIHGKSLQHDSIQVGLSRQIIQRYVDEWVVSITDYRPRARKMYELLQAGRVQQARDLLPPERPYPVDSAISRRLGMSVR